MYYSYFLLLVFGLIRPEHNIVGGFHRGAIYVIDEWQQLHQSHPVAWVFIYPISEHWYSGEFLVHFQVLQLGVVVDVVACQVQSV